MTADNPGRRVQRAASSNPSNTRAVTETASKYPDAPSREVGKRRGRIELPADIEGEDGMELVLPGGGTVTVYPSRGVDPAMVAARRMVLRAVREAGAGKKVRAPGGLTVVAVPGTEWVATVKAQWQAQFRGGSEPDDGEFELRNRRGRSWVAFCRDGTERSYGPGRGNDTVADAAWKGTAVVGFSASPNTNLPTQLTRSPDCRVMIPPLDAVMFRTVIAEVAGRAPAAEVPEVLAAAMTPDILRLARRPRQSADAYLARLATLAEAEAPTGRPGPDLDGIHGMDEAVDWGRRWVGDLAEYRAGRMPWAALDPATLLHGVPGTGKTMFAEALARSAGLPLVSASFARWQASGAGYLGDCLKAMRASFDEARRRAPCVLLIDEMDAIGSRFAERGGNGDYWTAVVTGALELLDGTERLEGVLVLGTTNDPGAIDPALLRSGRMDRLFEIWLPDAAALKGILRYHLGPDLPDADIAQVARLAIGASGADCARLVRTARQSARQGRRPMVPADLLAAVGTATPDPAVDRTIAVHEAGHAVATAVLRPGAVRDARIQAGAGLSGSSAAVPDTRGTREAIHGALLEILAGRAAEEVLLDAFSGGCGGPGHSDLAIATCHAVAIETALGLGVSGPLWQGQPTPDTVGTLLALRPALAARAQAYLEAVYTEAVALVRLHRGAVSAVADALGAMRSLTGPQIEVLVAAHRPDGSGAAP